jgi:asparagine synthase (glutamine-hydrolysing)
MNANNYIGKLGLRFANSQSPGLWANFHWNFKPKDIERLVDFKFNKGSAGITRRLFSLIEQSDFKSFRLGDEKALQILMERDSSIWLTNESNRKLDRISMAFSIEARSPFQDERVIEIGKQEMRKDKYQQLNKKVLWNLYPDLKSIGVRSDKAGFISPVGHWLRTNPKMINTAFEALIMSGFFEKSEIVKRHKDQFSGQFDKIRQLWSLVVLGYWLKMQDL